MANDLQITLVWVISSVGHGKYNQDNFALAAEWEGFNCTSWMVDDTLINGVWCDWNFNILDSNGTVHSSKKGPKTYSEVSFLQWLIGFYINIELSQF